MSAFSYLKFLSKLFVSLAMAVLMAACAQAPAKLANPSQYVRLGLLPAYEAKADRWTPPGWVESAKTEELELDFGLNQEVGERAVKYLSGKRQVVDLQSFSAAYAATPRYHSSGERKVIGETRTMFTDVIRTTVGEQNLDAYLVIEGGRVRLYQAAPPAPILTGIAPKRYGMSVRLSLYVVDGRTYEVAAATYNYLMEPMPAEWFTDPNRHAPEIKTMALRLIDNNLEPGLRRLGF
jgi:hypothetical protein